MCSVANNRNTDLKWLKQIVFIFLTYKSLEIGAVGTGSLSFVSIASWPQDGNFSSRHHTMFKARRGEWLVLRKFPLSLSQKPPSWLLLEAHWPELRYVAMPNSTGGWKGNIWQSATGHRIGLAQSWLIAWGLGRSPQSLNSTALYHLPEQNLSSRFC